MKATMLVLGLLVAMIGFTACAKYPVLTGASASAPAPTMAEPNENTPTR